MEQSTFDFGLNFLFETEAKTIVLVGRTGNGKSATGNSIIGEKVFDSMFSLGGVTNTCQMHTTDLANGNSLNVIDTPGLFDPSVDPKSIGTEIAKCISMAKNGIHAVLVVVSLRARFLVEEASAIESLSRFFGGKIGDYMILVFTHGDALGNMSLDEFLARKCPEPLLKTLELCGHRRVLFDNVTNDEVKKSQQLDKLLRLVNTVVDNNGGIPYTNELFVDFPDVSNNGLNGFLEKIESKLRETALMLEKQLAEERIARMEAEAKAQEVHMKSFLEMSQLKSDLEKAQRNAEELQKICAQTEHKFKEIWEKFKKSTEEKLSETEWKLKQKFGCVIQ